MHHALDLYGVCLARESQAPGETPHVSIYHETRLAEYMPQDHVGGLAADAFEFDQVVQFGRHLSAVPLDNEFGG